MTGEGRARPLVSVIIPTYNRAHRLGAALQSVLQQTYTEMEVIVVDDASTDSTQELLRAVADARVQVLRHPTNRGGSAARNTGLSASSGDLIAFLDSDDEWEREKLALQVAAFSTLPPVVGLLYAGAAYHYPDGEERLVRPRLRGWIQRELLLFNRVGSTSVAMIRREVLERVPGFDESLPTSQDVDFWVRIAEHFQIDFVPQTLVHMHVHEDPERISNDHFKRIEGREIFFAKHHAKMRDARVAHRYLSEMGRIYHRRLLDPRASRRMQLRAIGEYPLGFSSYARYLATFVPEPVYARAAGLGRQAISSMRRWFDRPAPFLTNR